MGSIGVQPHDVLIIGAGLSGICSLHHIRQQFPSFRIKVLEAGTESGGTWYWNCYPGARCDLESLSYCFSFDKELLHDWHWNESFARQPDILQYVRYICNKHDLYKDIQFETRVKSARWENDSHTWRFTDESGSQYRSTFFISCVGFLSAPTLPNITGIENFHGEAFHTSQWPKDLIISKSFAGKRVGVIGTGATGIQTITALSKEPSIKSLHVFQRTANWSAPLRNQNFTAQEIAGQEKEVETIFQLCAETPTGFLHKAEPRKTLEVSEEERMALWEQRYAEPGFSKWIGVFSDTYTDRQANALYSDFMASKIRARVDDPVVAEGLIPKTHGFGTRRVPLESGYFEAFNQVKVHLVDLRKSPIQKATPTAIVTENGVEYELDILIFATGFDAVTGAFSAINWTAKDGRPLLGVSGDPKGEQAVWVDYRPQTFLGITVPAMPNMFMVLGPHQPFGNATRSIEHTVQVICDLLQHCHDKGYNYVEPTPKAVQEWTDHVFECSKGSLINEVDSWMTGVNKNVAGKTVRTVARYAGSVIEYRRRCAECKAAGWDGLVFA